jgi:exonuclease VII large subunit
MILVWQKVTIVKVQKHPRLLKRKLSHQLKSAHQHLKNQRAHSHLASVKYAKTKQRVYTMVYQRVKAAKAFSKEAYIETNTIDAFLVAHVF